MTQPGGSCGGGLSLAAYIKSPPTAAALFLSPPSEHLSWLGSVVGKYMGDY